MHVGISIAPASRGHCTEHSLWLAEDGWNANGSSSALPLTTVSLSWKSRVAPQGHAHQRQGPPPILQIALTLMGCVKHRKAEPIYALKLNHHAPHALLARHYHERIIWWTDGTAASPTTRHMKLGSCEYLGEGRDWQCPVRRHAPILG